MSNPIGKICCTVAATTISVNQNSMNLLCKELDHIWRGRVCESRAAVNCSVTPDNLTWMWPKRLLSHCVWHCLILTWRDHHSPCLFWESICHRTSMKVLSVTPHQGLPHASKPSMEARCVGGLHTDTPRGGHPAHSLSICKPCQGRGKPLMSSPG